MTELLLLLCLTGTDTCARYPIVLEDPLSMSACASSHIAQAALADWRARHPGIDWATHELRWSCRIGGGEKAT